MEAYLFDRVLAQNAPIETLRNSTIGIDVEYYANRIIPIKKEPYLDAIGGFPSSLTKFIESDFQVFKEFNITPIYVFPGLKINPSFKQFKSGELTKSEKTHNSAWDKISKSDFNYHPSSNEFFKDFNTSVNLRRFSEELIKYLNDKNIEYLVSPYSTSFQLSYLYNEGLIDVIYGSTELLLTKIDKFILAIEFPNKEFKFVEKQRVLHDSNLNEQQFQDISICLGFSLQPYQFPIFPPSNFNANHIKFLIDLTFSNGDLYTYFAAYNDKKLLDRFLKARLSLKYVPILNKYGYTEIYLQSLDSETTQKEQQHSAYQDQAIASSTGGSTPSMSTTTTAQSSATTPSNTSSNATASALDIKIPNNLHEILGQRIPSELFFYFSIGLLSPELLESISFSKKFVRPPLDGGVAFSYRKLVRSKNVLEIANKRFNLLTSLLARYYQVKKIGINFWFDDEEIELNDRFNPPINIVTRHLYVKSNDSKNYPISFKLDGFLKTLSDGFLSQNINNDKITTNQLTTNFEIISTAVVRSLFLYDFVNKENKLTNWGNNLLKVNEFEHKEELILLLLLIRSDTLKLNETPLPDLLNVNKVYKSYIGSRNMVLPREEKIYILIISRVFSMIPIINSGAMNYYQGPISRSLLSFRSHIEFLKDELRETIQVNMLNSLVNNESNVRLRYDNAEWRDLVNEIPFSNNVSSTLTGVIAEVFTEYGAAIVKYNKDNNTPVEKEHVMDKINVHLGELFGQYIPEYSASFKRGVSFWKEFTKFISLIDDTKLVSDGLKRQVNEADVFLQQFI